MFIDIKFAIICRISCTIPQQNDQPFWKSNIGFLSRYFNQSQCRKSCSHTKILTNIQMFVVTDHRNNRFQKELVMQNTNIWKLSPSIIELAMSLFNMPRIVARAIIFAEGMGVIFIYACLQDEFLLKLIVLTVTHILACSARQLIVWI